MGIDVLLSPPLAFLVFLALAWLLYAFAGRFSQQAAPNPGKYKAYTGGEDIGGFKIQFGYKSFFFIALFFTMMHVAALVAATLPSGAFAFLGIFYLTMIFLSVAALLTRGTT